MMTLGCRWSKAAAAASWLLFFLGTALLGFLTSTQVRLAAKLGSSTQEIFEFSASDDLDAQRTIIISAYKKGGGNGVGDLLAKIPDAFYAYEPLINIAESLYFKNLTVMCTTFQNNCFRSTLSGMAVRLLRSLTFCSGANIMGDEYHQKWDVGGDVWLRYHECLEDKTYNKDFCDKFLAYQCQKAKVKVTKLERLSVQLMGILLNDHQNLTIVHMFRDPRGIIHADARSGAHTSLKTTAGIQEYARSLCARMSDDFDAGLKLSAMFPRRFKLMLFEDFKLDTAGVARLLFRFLGLSVAQITEFQQIQAEEHPFYWRTEITTDTLNRIDEICQNVYSKLGYNTYDSEEKLRDLDNWPSYGAGGVYPM